MLENYYFEVSFNFKVIRKMIKTLWNCSFKLCFKGKEEVSWVVRILLLIGQESGANVVVIETQSKHRLLSPLKRRWL